MVRNKALAAGAARWLDDLPGLIASLERDWRIAVGRPFPDATEAFVAEAVPYGAAGPSPVLKLMIPRAGDHARHEITVLRMAGGEGCARLLRADEDRGAVWHDGLSTKPDVMPYCLPGIVPRLASTRRPYWEMRMLSGVSNEISVPHEQVRQLRRPWTIGGRDVPEHLGDQVLRFGLNAHDGRREVTGGGEQARGSRKER